MVALYMMGGVLLLLFLLTLCPVRVDVAFREELQLTVGYLFLHFPLLPGEEGQPEPPPEEPPTQKPPGPGMADRLKAALRQKGVWGFLQVLADFAGVVGKASARLLSHLHLRQFDLYLRLDGAGDAALGAIRYGQVSAGVYSACGFIFARMPCKKKGVTVDMDYSAAEGLVDFSARLALRPLFLLTAGVKVLTGAMPLLKMLRGPGRHKKPPASPQSEG